MNGLRIIPTPPAWQQDANCQGTSGDTFFPEKGGTAQPAKRICARCNVRTQCRQWALDTNQQHGVWGGLTEDERRKLRRGGPGQPIRHNQRRGGLAEHHQVIVDMLARDEPATWAQIADAVGYSLDAVKAYWHRQKKAAA